MTGGDLSKELTDWHNLLQGGLGSFVGAVVGVLGAYLLALWTIRAQHKSDRELMREGLGVAAAESIALVLSDLAKAVRSLFHSQALRELGESDQAERRNALKTPVAALHFAIWTDGALLPEELVGHLRELCSEASDINFPGIDGDYPYNTLNGVTDLDSHLREVERLVREYRRDPSATTKNWRNKGRRHRRRQRFRQALGRAKRPLSEQANPDVALRS